MPRALPAQFETDAPDAGARLRLAERACADLARREAKNFYWGFLALPREKRMAVYALYGFARQVDDEADGPVRGATGGWTGSGAACVRVSPETRKTR